MEQNAFVNELEEKLLSVAEYWHDLWEREAAYNEFVSEMNDEEEI